MTNRLQHAYQAFLSYLFGAEVPENVSACAVTRAQYTEILHQVEEEFSINQGDPDYLEWVLTLIGRSPLIIEDTKGEEINE